MSVRGLRFIVAGFLLLSLQAAALEVPPSFESLAGRFVLNELGLTEARSMSSELEGRLASDLERVRTRLESEGAGRDLFSAGERKLSEVETEMLRRAFREEGQGVREFLRLDETSAGFEADRAKFLSASVLPKGEGITFISQRSDLLDGMVYKIEIYRNNFALGGTTDRFEQGAIDDYVRTRRQDLKWVGVNVIEVNPGSTVIEMPSVDALNARVALKGSGFKFEMMADTKPVVPKRYLELLRRGVLPIAPPAETARMFTHDLLVHAIGITAFTPVETVAALKEEAGALLRVYADGRVQISPDLKAFVRSVLLSEVNMIDRETATIMVHAASPREVRAVNLKAVFMRLSGGSERAVSLLLNPQSGLSVANRELLAQIARSEIPHPAAGSAEKIDLAVQKIDARISGGRP